MGGVCDEGVEFQVVRGGVYWVLVCFCRRMVITLLGASSHLFTVLCEFP